MHNFGNPRHTKVNDSSHNFDWVYLEIPEKKGIVGMLLAWPIGIRNSDECYIKDCVALNSLRIVFEIPDSIS